MIARIEKLDYKPLLPISYDNYNSSAMRRDADFFQEHQLDLVYMARTLRDSLKLEDILTEAGIDYLVETGSYTAGLLMKRELTGAFFYVSPQAWDYVKEILLRNRYQPYVEDQ
jgi:hypothetical protein